MGLRDIQIPTETVEVPGGSFTVRGLSFADILTLANSHGPQMALLFGRLTDKKQKIDDTVVKDMIRQVIPQFPDLVGEAIALASDDYTPEAIDIAKRLNFQYQTAALEKMFALTFTSEAELKNFMESIVRMLTGASGLMRQVRLPLSEAGFGASAAM